MTYAGISLQRLALFGLPHAGARYVGGSGRYERTQAWCAACGRPAAGCHHVVPLSVARTVPRRTPGGLWELRSPLLALCGSGTTGCHGAIHAGRLSVRWEWDSPEDEAAWGDGTLLDELGPHSPTLYECGRWAFDREEG